MVAVWAIAVGAGFTVLMQYASASGEQTRAPSRWPTESALSRSSERPTLLVFVHPHCACSHASVLELGRLLRRAPRRVEPLVVFVQPEGVPAGWGRSRLRRLAESLPGVRVIEDDGDTEARRFGAHTSGATLLYDEDGALRFAGGLTASRGHEGNSFGQERIVSLLRAGHADRDDSPVFGCPLREHTKESDR